MLTVDHRLTLGSPAFPSAPDKESFSRVSSPNLRVQRLHVDRPSARTLTAGHAWHYRP